MINPDLVRSKSLALIPGFWYDENVPNRYGADEHQEDKTLHHDDFPRIEKLDDGYALRWIDKPMTMDNEGMFWEYHDSYRTATEAMREFLILQEDNTNKPNWIMRRRALPGY